MTCCGWPARFVGQRVRDLLELVGGARVLGLRVVVEVEVAACRRRPRSRGSSRSGASSRRSPARASAREADHLGVAAALDVEDAAVAPAVLVVADQAARGIGRERRLAGPGEAEEDGDVARRRRRSPSSASASTPSSGRRSFITREDRLLDLAGVVRAADQDLASASGAGRRRCPVRVPSVVGVGLDVRRVQDERLRLEARELLGGRLDEHRLREQRVLRLAGDRRARRSGARGRRRRRRRRRRASCALEVRDDLVAQAVEAAPRRAAG